MNARLDELRSLLASRFPGTLETVFSTQDAPQRPPRAGLVPGKVVEVVSAAGCGGEGLLLRRLMEETAGTLALVDGADAFDPPLLSPELRQRLLWLRCHQAAAAVRAADLLLRDGNLAAVLLDLRLLPERELLRLPSSVWHRLRMLAGRTNVAVGVFSPCRLVPCAARRWVMQPAFDLEALEETAATLAGRLQPLPAAEAGALAIAS